MVHLRLSRKGGFTKYKISEVFIDHKGGTKEVVLAYFRHYDDALTYGETQSDVFENLIVK